MNASVDRWSAAVMAALSAIALLYVGYCQLNMNAPWLDRDQAFLLFLAVPLAVLGGAASRLGSPTSPLSRIGIWTFYVAGLVAIVQLFRFFAAAHAVTHAF